MIFRVKELISYISTILTLEPGDIITTGTPEGTGLPRGRLLHAGIQCVAGLSRWATLRILSLRRRLCEAAG